MRIYQYRNKLLAVFFVLAIASLSCSLPLLRSQEPTEVIDNALRITVVEENQPDQAPDTVLPQSNEPFFYQVSEPQLTSMLINALKSRPDLGVTEPRVYLRDGVVEIRGQVQQSGLRLPLVIQLRLFIDAQHQLQYEILSAKVGPFSLPNSLLDQISTYIDQALSNSLDIDQDDVYFEQVNVENGMLTVSGYLL